MRPSGHRAIGALALLLVFLVGAAAFLPLSVRGQPYQITGLVSTCGTVTPYVSGATVTLIEVNGANPNRNRTTNGAGVYSFLSPPTGNYIIAVNRSGYYPAMTSTPVRFDGSATVTIDVCMVRHGSPPKVLTVTVLSSGVPVPSAKVDAFNVSNPTGNPQLVATGSTDAAGVVNLTLWGDPFQLRTSANGYQTVSTNVDVGATSAVTVNLIAGVEIFGHVREPSGAFIDTGVIGWLYDPAAANTSAFRLIPAVVTSSLFDFHAPAGAYTILIDAKNYLTHRASITLPLANPYDVVLQPAPKERYETTVLYGTQDWNNLTVWRNLTLNADSTLTGLVPADLRDLRLQIDATPTLGNGDGTLAPGEITAFTNWLIAKGPAYVTTDEFLKTNGRSYLSSIASYSLTVEGLATASGKVWINTSATYALKQTPPFIAYGAKTYFVNTTLIPDANATSYFDFVYNVALPRRYERDTSVVSPSGTATLANFTRITIDPGITSANRVNVTMTVSQALNGTTRAKVVAPTGKFHAQNATFTNYTAFVAKDTELTFSARDSMDPNGPVDNNNFTWRFRTSPLEVRWGIEPKFKYTVNGTFIVNVTMREAGLNLSYRDITIIVDDQLPIANITTNRTGGGLANGVTLRVDSGIPVIFRGGTSSDYAYPGKRGVILDAGFAWDFDGNKVVDATGRTVTHAFTKPGNFTLNLTVTDSVGWKGVNATMTVVVNDTKAPVPAFDILDPESDWGTITSPMERKAIAFNASKTTDDYDKVATMNFTWTIPGLIVGRSGVDHKFYGVNVTFAWQEWNNSYSVKLSVTDSGFRGGPPATPKPNTGNLTRNITVQIDTTIHADLRIDQGTLKVVPTDPEEGAPVTVTVNVTNKPSRMLASNVTTELAVISGGVTTVLPATVQWFKGGAETSDHTIASGSTVTLVFTARISGQGNKTLRVYVYDSSEPYTWRTPENRVQNPVNVRQPWWQPYAIAGSVIGVIVLFVFAMYARRKIKAGEWRPIRGRRGEKGTEEKPRKDVKEEKKRL